MASPYLTLSSYEGHIVGYRLDPAALSADGTPEQRRAAAPTAFALKAHDGCVRAVASGGAYLATCGTDHAISVYNVRKLREQGKLLQQAGGASLHCLAFFNDSHLVSGGGDGELCIWRASDWECLLRMKGHKGAVHAIAIHPSGRAALSVAADSKLMLWNLTTGKCNYTTALAEAARLVAMTPDGESYVYDTRRALLLHGLRSGALLHTFPHGGSPPLSVAFASDGLMLSGDDAGTLRAWSVARGECVHTEQRAHERRIKAIAMLPSAAEDAEDAEERGSAKVKCKEEAPRTFAFATASSDGSVSVWRLTAASGKKAAKPGAAKPAASVRRLFSLETRLRLTSLAASSPSRRAAAPLAAAALASQAAAPEEEEEDEEEEQDDDDDDDDDDEEEEEEVVVEEEEEVVVVQPRKPSASRDTKALAGGAGKKRKPGAAQPAASVAAAGPSPAIVKKKKKKLGGGTPAA